MHSAIAARVEARLGERDERPLVRLHDARDPEALAKSDRKNGERELEYCTGSALITDMLLRFGSKTIVPCTSALAGWIAASAASATRRRSFIICGLAVCRARTSSCWQKKSLPQIRPNQYPPAPTPGSWRPGGLPGWQGVDLRAGS